MNSKLFIKTIFLLLIIAFAWNELFAQCTSQITHQSGTDEIDGVQVTVTPSGDYLESNYCTSAMPYAIGHNLSQPNHDGSFTF